MEITKDLIDTVVKKAVSRHFINSGLKQEDEMIEEYLDAMLEDIDYRDAVYPLVKYCLEVFVDEYVGSNSKD